MFKLNPTTRTLNNSRGAWLQSDHIRLHCGNTTEPCIHDTTEHLTVPFPSSGHIPEVRWWLRFGMGAIPVAPFSSQESNIWRMRATGNTLPGTSPEIVRSQEWLWSLITWRVLASWSSCPILVLNLSLVPSYITEFCQPAGRWGRGCTDLNAHWALQILHCLPTMHTAQMQGRDALVSNPKESSAG